MRDLLSQHIWEKRGQTEIQDLRPVLTIADDVRALQVPVHEPAFVRVGHGAGKLGPDARDGARRQPVVRNDRLEGPPLDIFHGDPWLPVRVADVVDLADVRVIERRGGLRFPHQPTSALLGIVRSSVEDFESDLTAEPLVACEIDCAHPASADD